MLLTKHITFLDHAIWKQKVQVIRFLLCAEIFRESKAFWEREREHTQVCDRTNEQNNAAIAKKIKHNRVLGVIWSSE